MAELHTAPSGFGDIPIATLRALSGVRHTLVPWHADTPTPFLWRIFSLMTVRSRTSPTRLSRPGVPSAVQNSCMIPVAVDGTRTASTASRSQGSSETRSSVGERRETTPGVSQLPPQIRWMELLDDRPYLIMEDPVGRNDQRVPGISVTP